MPITTYYDLNHNDDISYDGCGYAADCTDDLPDSRLVDWDGTCLQARDPLAEIFQVDASTIENSHDVYHYMDGWVMRDFEGLSFPGNDTFDNSTYHAMRFSQKAVLVYMFDKDARRLTFSRLMRRPMALMQKAIDCSLGLDTCTDPSSEIEDLTRRFPTNLKYLVYSAHDDQMFNVMQWLHPSNIRVDWVYLASQAVFELYSDADCLATTADESCFRVGVRYNGHEAAFDACESSARSDGTGCSWTDFKAYLDLIWFYKMDLDQACDVPYVRHKEFN